MVLDAARNTERGSVIFMLFIAVALFGLLAFAMLQGSRGNLTMMSGEAQKAQATQVQDCTNGVDMAERRLQAKGCGALVSHNTDGSNTNPGAPSDGSCSIYHSNGGGMKPCAAAATVVCDLTALAIGDRCDGIVFAGTSGGNRIYTTESDTGAGVSWNNGTVSSLATGVISATDGSANTNSLVALSNAHSPYAAAVMCRALGAKWYLPAENELALLYANRLAIGNFSTGGTINDFYWASNESSGTHTKTVYFQMGVAPSVHKYQAGGLRVRCVRRD